MIPLLSPSVHRQMTRPALLPLLLLLAVSACEAGLSDIFKNCKDVDCSVDTAFSPFPAFNPSHNFRWMVAGLPFIFWDAVRTKSLFNQTHSLSRECQQKLVKVSEGLQLNEEWAFHFPDSSGKSPPAILKATVASFGDYDQCLDIDSHGVQGMYCVIDTHHLRKKSAPGQLALSKVSVFDGHPFYSALCLPAGCTIPDIREVLQQLLRPHYIKVAGDFHCDTKQSTSYTTRLLSLSRKQVFSLVFVTSILTAVAISTCSDVCQRITQLDKEHVSCHPESHSCGIFKSLSLLTSSHKLFYSKPWKTYELMVFDVTKTTAILATSLSHVLICAEAPLAYSTISQHSFLDFVLTSPLTMVLNNDSGLLMVPFLTGVATFSIAYPMAKSGKLPYGAAVADRIIRFVPPLLVLLACEFVWPILGSGPLYTRVGKFNLQKCEKNWFYNILFVNNFINSIDICGGHSFFSAVDMQLFLLGLLVVFAFSRSEKAGLCLTAVMILFGTLKVPHAAYSYDTAFALLNTIPDKVVEYFHVIHMQTYSYMQAYFVGFIIAYARMNGYLEMKNMSRRQIVILFILFVTVMSASVVNLALHHTFHLYPPSTSWLFIGINRTLLLISVAIGFMISYAGEYAWDAWARDFFLGPNVDMEAETFSPLRAMSKLSFPLYICNYLYIRSEFFTRRHLEPIGLFWTFKRLISSVILLYAFTIAFQLLLLAPVDALRQRLMRSSSKVSDKRGHRD